MRIVVESVDSGGSGVWNDGRWACVSVWDGARKIAELNVEHDPDSDTYRAVVGLRENVTLQTESPA